MILHPFWSWTSDDSTPVATNTVTCIGMGIHQPSAKVNLGGWLGRLILAWRFNYGNA
jgi:hypothetical protein